MARPLAGMSVRGLRWALGLFFLALAIPTAVLIQQTYSRLQWEAFHQHQLLAEELAARIDQRFATLVAAEEAHPFTDYTFLTVAGDPAANFLQRSPLSAYPPEPAVPGLLGYFQVDAAGAFSTPLLPAPGTDTTRVGIPAEELAARQTLAARIQRVLGENRLVRRPEREPAMPPARLAEDEAASAPVMAESAPPASSEGAGQALFDSLNRAPELRSKRAAGSLGKLEDLQLAPQLRQSAAQEERKALPEPRLARKEQSALPETLIAGRSAAPAAPSPAESPRPE